MTSQATHLNITPVEESTAFCSCYSFLKQALPSGSKTQPVVFLILLPSVKRPVGLPLPVGGLSDFLIAFRRDKSGVTRLWKLGEVIVLQAWLSPCTATLGTQLLSYKWLLTM